MKNWLLAESDRGAGHRADAAHVRLLAELGLDVRLVRTAAARARRIAALGHEARDHAVEDDAVIEALADQFLDALDVARRQVGTHLDRDRTGSRASGSGCFRGRPTWSSLEWK
jgi:hypothetical protein